jgi:hypothetical protein
MRTVIWVAIIIVAVVALITISERSNGSPCGDAGAGGNAACAGGN